MKLYLISQDCKHEYDTYDSFVVCADSEIAAKMTHPSNNQPDWDGSEGSLSTWVNVRDVTVKEIGLAHPDTEVGIVCVSFNAG